MISTEQRTKICDHCSGSINVSYSTCPFCGGYQEEKETAVESLCPRCKTRLNVHTVDDDEYDICPQCSGLWLDSDEFHWATRKRNADRKVRTRKKFRRSPISAAVDYIPCVRCGKLMNRINFGKISGVLIDTCEKHGVWLDAGELEKIQHFIADGGLDRARDREINRNRSKIRDLATTVDQTAFTQKIIHFWNFKRWLFGR